MAPIQAAAQAQVLSAQGPGDWVPQTALASSVHWQTYFTPFDEDVRIIPSIVFFGSPLTLTDCG